VVRARSSDGQFLITIFSPPDHATDTPAEVGVLIQQAETGAAVLDADVSLRFTAPAGASLPARGGWCGPMNATFLVGAAPLAQSPPIPATHEQAANKLLYAARVILPARGAWGVDAAVYRQGALTLITATLPVQSAPSRLAILWPWLALPAVAVALFALHQRLRTRRPITR
jgi:hypothetical protein